MVVSVVSLHGNFFLALDVAGGHYHLVESWVMDFVNVMAVGYQCLMAGNDGYYCRVVGCLHVMAVGYQ